MRVTATFALTTALLLSACSGTRMIVVESPPTGDVTITVIPGSYTKDEIDFAAAVESRLLPYVHILERPPFRFMNTDQQRTDSGAVGGHGWAAGTSVTEPIKVTDVVAMYPDSKATYVVTSYADDRRIRIVERASNTLVAAIRIPSEQTNDPDDFGNRIYSALGYAKIIQKGFAEKDCRVVGQPKASN